MKNETARREIESLDYYLQNHTNDYSEESHTAMMMAVDALSSSENLNKWIPIKTRPLTEKEKEYFFADVELIYDCELPDEGEVVLITDKWGNVETDTFYRDDGCYFENNSGEDDVVAWMPLPESYKAESEGKE